MVQRLSLLQQWGYDAIHVIKIQSGAIQPFPVTGKGIAVLLICNLGSVIILRFLPATAQIAAVTDIWSMKQPLANRSLVFRAVDLTTV